VNNRICHLCGNPLPEGSTSQFHSGPCPLPKLRDEGIPTEPGWYWCYRDATRTTHEGIDLVEVRRGVGESLYVYGFPGGAKPEQIAKVWQRVKQYDTDGNPPPPPPTQCMSSRYNKKPTDPLLMLVIFKLFGL